MGTIQQMLLAEGSSGGGGGGSSFSIVGVSFDLNNTTISIPVGAAAGDMLILSYTNGNNSGLTMHSSFTGITSGGTGVGCVGWRTMVGGDTSFTFGAAMFSMLAVVRRTSGTPAIDSSVVSSYYTSNGTFTTPNITPSVADTLAINLFLSGQSFFTAAPTPPYTPLMSYNHNGVGVSGMAATWTALSTTSTFTGSSINGSAAAAHGAVACQVVIK